MELISICMSQCVLRMFINVADSLLERVISNREVQIWIAVNYVLSNTHFMYFV
jgi:hypothetical protein